MLAIADLDEPLTDASRGKDEQHRESNSEGAREEDGEQPYDANICGIIWATWVFRGILKRTRALRPDESLPLKACYALSPDFKPKLLCSLLIDAWKEEVKVRQRNASVLRACWRVHGRSLMLAGSGFVLMTLIRMLDPLYTNLLISYAGNEDATIAYGLFLSVTFLCTRLTYICLENFLVFYRERLGQKVKTGFVAVIFTKTLAMRQDSFLSFSSGKLNNMITTDVEQGRQCLTYIDPIVTIPLQVLVFSFALHHFFGMAFFIGLAYMLIQGNLNQPIMRLQKKRNKEAQQKTDARVKLVGEILDGIGVVKCYAWEDAAKIKVAEARKQEIKAMWGYVRLNLVQSLVMDSLVPVTMIVIFTAFDFLYPDKSLDAPTVFTAVNLMESLRGCLWQVPWLLTNWVQAQVSAKRIQGMLLLPEADLPITHKFGGLDKASSQVSQGDGLASNARSTTNDRGESTIHLDKATFAWSKVEVEDDDETTGSCCTWLRSRLASPGGVQAGEGEVGAFRLKDLTVSVPPGSLVAVVGATASGKTSLLQAILGEMPQTNGTGTFRVDHSVSIAFAPQQPWIFNGTCRENILFGEEYNEKAYKEAIECCQLQSDFSLLRNGDLTRVGEKGIALSGGQKARLALARAVYRKGKSDIFLLDDPYSALDTHVAEKVHKTVVCKLLKGKTRVVVTNRLEFISSCTILLVLENGKIESSGPYEKIRNSSRVLRELLSAHNEASSGKPESEPAPSLRRAISDKSQGSTGGAPSLSRQVSGKSDVSAGDTTEEPESEKEEQQQEEKEEEEFRMTGTVNKEVLLYYIRSMGGYFIFAVLSLMYVTTQVLSLAALWWLSIWTSKARVGSEAVYYLGVYTALSLGSTGFGLIVSIVTYVVGYRAATKLHDAMFASVLRAPMSWFQVTPKGRIINRFSNDTSEVDTGVVRTLTGTIQQFASTLGSLIVMGVNSYFSLIVFAPFIRVYVYVQIIYNRACTELRRLSKTTRSPVYDHFSNLIRENGLSVVRALHEVGAHINLNSKLLEQQMRCPMTMWYVENWYYQRVEPLGALLVFLVCLFIALGHNKIVTSQSAALSLSLALTLIYRLPGCIRMFTEITIKFNCVERVLEFTTNLPAEASAIVESEQPGPNWPTKGVLEVKDLRFRYGPGKPLVLHGITFEMKAGERIGIVGRSGAGKSTILLALFRIVEPEPGSRLHMDGVDMLKIGLKDLRSSITMIPQDPVLFEETLLYNCDPFGQRSPEEVWKALDDAQLGPTGLVPGPWLQSHVQHSPADPTEAIALAGLHPQPQEHNDKEQGEENLLSYCMESPPEIKSLQYQIQEGGQNLSAGQRQLVALARAMLRRSNFVVFDEATAALDARTDAAIQRAILKCFEGASSLTIAHRLGTIMDCNRIMVLKEGVIDEFDSPEKLKAKPGGTFASMYYGPAGPGSLLKGSPTTKETKRSITCLF